MERRKKVELFEEIRREYEFAVGTIKGVARKLRVHRRMVRQALADAQPPERKRAEREWPVLRPLIPFIDGIPEMDRKAPRKQRHTAHRLWQRIRAEIPEQPVAESTIRRYVRERKQELGWSSRTTCVPQPYELGQEGQVDWYEAWGRGHRVVKCSPIYGWFTGCLDAGNLEAAKGFARSTKRLADSLSTRIEEQGSRFELRLRGRPQHFAFVHTEVEHYTLLRSPHQCAGPPHTIKI